MGLRREVLEEMEEREIKEASESIMNSTCDDFDRDIHGIGWNILHNKFIGDDGLKVSKKEGVKAQYKHHKLKKGL